MSLPLPIVSSNPSPRYCMPRQRPLPSRNPPSLLTNSPCSRYLLTSIVYVRHPGRCRTASITRSPTSFTHWVAVQLQYSRMFTVLDTAERDEIAVDIGRYSWGCPDAVRVPNNALPQLPVNREGWGRGCHRGTVLRLYLVSPCCGSTILSVRLPLLR